MYLFSCVLYALFVSAYSASIKNGFESALLGSEQCLESSYWCTNFSTATQCRAVKHCIQAVWLTKNNEYSYCNDCVKEILAIRNSIDSDITKAMIQDLLESICYSDIAFLIRKTCLIIVDQYVDNNLNELLDLIKSEVDANTICHLLGLCLSEGKTEIHTERVPIPNMYEDDAVVRFENIELHFPASYLHLPDMTTLLGSTKCTWGPAYWCSNVTTSRECETTSHCIDSVWSRNDYPQDNDSVCQVCKDMVKQARDQLLSNETQEELKEVFDGSCKLIPIHVVTKECIAMVDEFIPELTDMLVSTMDPNTVCTVAGLCNSVRIDRLIAVHGIDSKVELDSCMNCSVAFTEVGRYMQNTPKSVVLSKLIDTCDVLSSFSDICVTLVNKYFEDMYPTLKTIKPLPTCHLTGMCVAKYYLHPLEHDNDQIEKAELALKSSSEDLPCDLCKQLVTHFKEVVTANTTVDEFKEVLEGICKQTGKFEEDCLNLVKDNFEIIYDYFTKELDPATICKEVGLCPRKNFVSDAKLNLISFKPPSDIKTSETTDIAVAGPIECRFCRSVISLLQSELTNPKIKHDVEKILKNVCDLVPSNDKQTCLNFIDQYSETLIDILSQETDPGIVCSVIDLCLNTRLVNRYDLCPVCQNVMHFLQNEIEDQKTEEQIENAVKKICQIVPSAEKRECDEFVFQYSALFISILAEEIDPSLVCPALKLCPDYSSFPDSCHRCRNTMKAFIDSLENRKSVHILKKMKELPRNLPVDSTVLAVQLKIEHSLDIVDMMTAEFSADESCAYLEYCKSPIEKQLFVDMKSNEVDTVILKSTTKPSCKMCQLFIKIYEDKLSSNTTEEALEKFLTKFCKEVKSPELQKNCSALIYEYLPKLVDYLKKDVNPKELCQLAEICPTSLEDSTLESCRACEAILGSFEGVLRDPYISNIPLNKIGKICHDLPAKTRKICELIVFELGPTIEGLLYDIPPWYYCSKIHMCPFSQDLILTKECTKGEGFWCQNQQTAEICDKLKYCEKIWNSDKPSRR